MYIYICIYIIYIYIYFLEKTEVETSKWIVYFLFFDYLIYISIFISGHKRFPTQRVLKSHRSNLGIIYMQS